MRKDVSPVRHVMHRYGRWAVGVIPEPDCELCWNFVNDLPVRSIAAWVSAVRRPYQMMAANPAPAGLPCPYCENIDGHSFDCPRPRAANPAPAGRRTLDPGDSQYNAGYNQGYKDGSGVVANPAPAGQVVIREGTGGPPIKFAAARLCAHGDDPWSCGERGNADEPCAALAAARAALAARLESDAGEGTL